MPAKVSYQQTDLCMKKHLLKKSGFDISWISLLEGPGKPTVTAHAPVVGIAVC